MAASFCVCSVDWEYFLFRLLIDSLKTNISDFIKGKVTVHECVCEYIGQKMHSVHEIGTYDPDIVGTRYQLNYSNTVETFLGLLASFFSEPKCFYVHYQSEVWKHFTEMFPKILKVFYSKDVCLKLLL